MVDLFKMRMLIRRDVKVRWRLEQEEARATKITTRLTGMPRGGKQSNQVEEGAIKISELKEAYGEILSELRMMQQELDPLISELEDPDDRAVMRLRYIGQHSAEDIAEAIHKTDRTIYYWLSRAEDQLARKFPDQVKK